MTSSHFTLKLVLLALVCYGVYYRWSPGDYGVIELTPPLIDGIAERQEAFLGRPLTDSERVEATDSYIEEEILVREAFRQGLDRGDRRVRPMLIEHASRELLRAAEYEPSTPSESALRSYFEEHAERYRVPERIDMQQVLFPAGTVPAALDDVLTELRGGADFTRMGAAGAGADVKEVTLSRIAQAFGLDFANDVFALPEGAWHGPFTSSAGTHFFRIQERWSGRERSYEDVKDYIEQDFMRGIEAQVVEAELARIRRRYRVDIEDVD